VQKISEAAVLKRAKDLCKQDSYEWELEFKPVLPMGTKIILKPILKEVERTEYLARAREQLLKECAENV
jgi:hypothetical protein